MSPVQSADRRNVTRLQQVQVASPWEAVLFPLSAFPAPDRELAFARSFLQKLVAELTKKSPVLETFIRFAALHLGDRASLLSRNGRQWMPAMGLGVWPDREPPTLWTLEELQDLAPGEKVRPLMDIVLRVTGPPESRNQARDFLLGVGTVIHMVGRLNSDQLLVVAAKLLLPPIQDPALTSFQFYMPLLEAKSVAAASASRLDAWSCGADAYIRESPEDGGILVLARSLGQTLSQIGCFHPTDLPEEWDFRGE